MKKFFKDVQGFNRNVVGMSLGATILQRVGGGVASGGLQGLQQASHFLPSIGSLLGAKHALRMVKKLK